MLDDTLLEELVALRHDLHRHAELSDHEEATAERIANFLTTHGPPDEVVRGLGGAGLAVVYSGASSGPTVLLRAELDALPIPEPHHLAYRSLAPGASHKCGHDGHMAVVAGVGAQLGRRRPRQGRAVLLFQPSEETGQGARRVMADPRFAAIRPDWVFALHNLPELAKGCVAVRADAFSAASCGAVIRLTGATAHAAFPEEGRSPARAVARLLEGLSGLPRTVEVAGDFAVVTVIHARLGEVAFGTAPGEAVVMATLRSDRDDTVKVLKDAARRLAEEVASSDGLECEVSWAEEFPATVNHPDAVALVREVAAARGVPLLPVAGPYRWSEDFGWFVRGCPGALFGLGAGVRHQPLHSPGYDFPDDLIPVGVGLFAGLLGRLLGNGV